MLTPTTRTLLAALALTSGLGGLSGCGFGYEAAPVLPVSPVADTPIQIESVPAPATTPDASLSTFTIDVGAAVGLDEATYAITTNGTDWTVAWRGDGLFRRFRGELINGSRFSGLAADGMYAGDVVRQTASNRISFDTHTDAHNIQSVTVRSGSEPVRFNLWIDGYPATYSVIFSSGGIESTTDDMPFDLITGFFTAGRSAPRVDLERAAFKRVTAPADRSTASVKGTKSERPIIKAPAASSTTTDNKAQ